VIGSLLCSSFRCWRILWSLSG